MSGHALFILACIHPVISYRAGWNFYLSTSLGIFRSSKQAAPCMQARIMRAHLFYLGIDDFVSVFKSCQNKWQQIIKSTVRITMLAFVLTRPMSVGGEPSCEDCQRHWKGLNILILKAHARSSRKNIWMKFVYCQCDQVSEKSSPSWCKILHKEMPQHSLLIKWHFCKIVLNLKVGI